MTFWMNPGKYDVAPTGFEPGEEASSLVGTPGNPAFFRKRGSGNKPAGPLS